MEMCRNSVFAFHKIGVLRSDPSLPTSEPIHREKPLFFLLFGLLCIVENLCVVRGYERHKNSPGLPLNNAKHAFEPVT